MSDSDKRCFARPVRYDDAYGMRIVLTHEYFRVDASIVWATVKKSLPELEKLLQQFAGELDGTRP